MVNERTTIELKFESRIKLENIFQMALIMENRNGFYYYFHLNLFSCPMQPLPDNR